MLALDVRVYNLKVNVSVGIGRRERRYRHRIRVIVYVLACFHPPVVCCEDTWFHFTSVDRPSNGSSHTTPVPDYEHSVNQSQHE